MSKNIGSNKASNLFRDGVLIQLKQDGGGFKIITHLDHLEQPIRSNIADRFDAKGNYKGNDFGD